MTRRIRSDIHGHLDPGTVNDDEIALVLSDDARCGLLKLLGKQSRETYMTIGLNDAEINDLSALYSHWLN